MAMGIEVLFWNNYIAMFQGNVLFAVIIASALMFSVVAIISSMFRIPLLIVAPFGVIPLILAGIAIPEFLLVLGAFGGAGIGIWVYLTLIR